MEGTIAEIRLFGGNFAPRNWAQCHGQLLPISRHEALFSIIGTIYGGDGRETFALPDLRGRSAVGDGQGLGLSNVPLGSRLGVETVTLNTDQIPSHSHSATTTANASSVPGNEIKPRDKIWAASSAGDAIFSDSSSITPLAANAVETSIGNTGGNHAHENRSPQLGMNFIICLEGRYPSRS